LNQLGNSFWKVIDGQGGRAVGLVPLGDGRLVWFVQYDCDRFPSPQPWRSLTFLQELLAGFPPLVWQAIDACESRPYLWHPIDADPPSRLVRANLALVGDAAHPLLPFTSQGVNMALADAEFLAESLFAPDPAPGRAGGSAAAVTAALAAYERRRIPELPAYVQAGRQLAEDFVAPGQAHRLPLVL
jgi:2-polyprenyl-6-methoxyphenol hydroxylase-like FAD-dependent oxidoreductase